MKVSVNVDDIPDSVIDSLADLILPGLQAFYESEEGKKLYAEWKASQAEKKAS